MRKQTITLAKHINKSVKIGHLVYLIDGSGLSLHEDYIKHDDVYIVDSYPELVKDTRPLKHITFEVVKIKVKNKAMMSAVSDKAYIQDIVVRVNGIKFRTCSSFVKII